MTSHTLQNQSQEQGFTLIELSIVLIIIGLIVSSVLVGQDLIRGAEIRAIQNEISQYNSAAGTFRVKFNNALPGDADGDRLYEPTTAANHDGELPGFWQALGDEDYIPGTFSGADVPANPAGILPDTPVGGFWGIARDQAATDALGNVFILGAGGTDTSFVYTVTPLISAIDAAGIDARMDDGVANTGIVRSVAIAGTPAGPDSSLGCAYDGTDATLCAVMFEMSQ